VCLERLPGQVHPVAFDDVLADVAQEVRQLERLAESGRVGERPLRMVRVHDGGHHPADGGGRPVHVLLEFVVRLVAVFRDVSDHGVDERVDVCRVDVVPLDEFGDGRQDGVLGLLDTDCRTPDSFETRPLFGRRRGVFRVDDLVSHPEERVEHVRGVTDASGEESGRQMKRLPGPLLDCLAALDLFFPNHCGKGGGFVGRTGPAAEYVDTSKDSSIITLVATPKRRRLHWAARNVVPTSSSDRFERPHERLRSGALLGHQNVSLQS
jgi:hypothetical protein